MSSSELGIGTVGVRGFCSLSTLEDLVGGMGFEITVSNSVVALEVDLVVNDFPPAFFSFRYLSSMSSRSRLKASFSNPRAVRPAEGGLERLMGGMSLLSHSYD